MMIRKLATVLFLLTLIVSAAYAEEQAYDIDGIFKELDKVVLNADAYIKQRQDAIAAKKHELAIANTDGERFVIHRQLYLLYKKYNAEQALQHCENIRQLGLRNHRSDWLLIAGINAMREAVVRNDLMLARDILQSLGDVSKAPIEIRMEYAIGALHFASQIKKKYQTTNKVFLKEVTETLRLNTDTLLSYVPKSSPYYNIALSLCELLDRVDYNMLKKCCDREQTNDVGAGMFDYCMAKYLLQQRADSAGYQYYLAKAVIADVKTANFKSQALLDLLQTSYLRSNPSRSYHYARLCSQNAVDFNLAAHSTQVIKASEIVNHTYIAKINQQRKWLAWGFCVIAVALCVIVYLYWLHRRENTRLKQLTEQQEEYLREISGITSQLKEKNKQLRAEIELRDTNFMASYYLCSSFLGKYNQLKKEVYNLLVAHSYKQALSLAASTEVSNEAQRDFFRRFDDAYLSTHPDFVERLNRLLRPEERYAQVHPEELSISLRIYALISLGINNSIEISEFLQYSTQTIYNRRLKMRHKACIDGKMFAEAVLNLYDDERLEYYLREYRIPEQPGEQPEEIHESPMDEVK